MKTLQLTKPHLLVMIGWPGSGKTTFGEKFGDTFNAPFIDAKRLLSDAGDPLPASTVYELLAELQKTKQTIVFEAMSGTRTERNELAKLARIGGYETLFVWVQTDQAVARVRATKRTRSNPHPLNDELFDQEVRRFTPPGVTEKVVVLSGMHTYASQAKTVLKKLTERSRPQQLPQALPPRETTAVRRSVTVQ